ncbi:MAG TPA: hypothetical protein VFF59_11500 [Anaerolineae bacterium]|nr:hypothetical protein [Anaerolineae bacterium]
MRSTITIVLSVAVLVVTASIVSAAATAGPGTSTIIAVTPGDSKDPAVAYGNSITHAVWVESGWILHSRNTGLGWTVPISVAQGDEPSLLVDHSGTPHIAFTERFNTTFNVYHTRYVTGAWTLPQRISNGTDNTASPDIAVAPNNELVMVWSQQRPATTTKQIETAESTNGGVTWPLTGPILDAHGSSPRIAIGSDGVTHVVWQDDTATPFHINHVERSTGAWSPAAVLSDDAAPAFTPDLTTLADKAHVVWEQANAILYASGSGLTFSTPVTISLDSASEPTIATTPIGKIAAAWDSGITITLRIGGPGGWGAVQALGVNPAGANHVALATGPTDYTYAVFASGATGSRDIAFNYYVETTFKLYLPLALKNG